jgi:hypothetical protein
MSAFKARRCDQCGKVSEDSHAEMGWITLEGCVTVRLGKRGGGSPRYAAHGAAPGRGVAPTTDYCSIQCLVVHLSGLAGKKMCSGNVVGELWDGIVKVSSRAQAAPTVTLPPSEAVNEATGVVDSFHIEEEQDLLKGHCG